MNRDLRRLVDAGDGVVTRCNVLALLPSRVLDNALQARQLIRLFPKTYADASRADQPQVRAAAALAYAGPHAALSHLTALGLWRLPGGDLTGPIHVSVGGNRRLRAGKGIIVHRRSEIVSADVTRRYGLTTSTVERSVVDSWRLLSTDTKRAAVITAVADRRTTPARLLTVVDRSLSLPGRFDLVRLLNLLAAGCRSELELWGYDRVFTGPDMPAVERNVAMRLGERTIYLDVYCRDARVNFELDGAKWHASAGDRERDSRRDAALAAIGIMVVRFTHDRLTTAPEQVRAEVRAIIAARGASPLSAQWSRS